MKVWVYTRTQGTNTEISVFETKEKMIDYIINYFDLRVYQFKSNNELDTEYYQEFIDATLYFLKNIQYDNVDFLSWREWDRYTKRYVYSTISLEIVEK